MDWKPEKKSYKPTLYIASVQWLTSGDELRLEKTHCASSAADAGSLRVFNRCYYIRCFYFIIRVSRHRCKSNFNRKKGQQIQLNIRLNYEGVNKILVDRHYVLKFFFFIVVWRIYVYCVVFINIFIYDRVIMSYPITTFRNRVNNSYLRIYRIHALYAVPKSILYTRVSIKVIAMNLRVPRCGFNVSII